MFSFKEIFADRWYTAAAAAIFGGFILAFASGGSQDGAQAVSLGKPLSEEVIAAADLSITPDGTNLPAGSGTPAQGKIVFAKKCAVCHGPEGKWREGLAKPPLVGGIGTLKSDKPVQTVGSFWPYATTLFDYVRRAMPLNAPLSLSDDEVYAVSAYILSLNGIIKENAVIDAKSLLKVEMPNRSGFVSRWPGHTH